MFGHQINLQFNKRGYTHNTCIGGLCSIALLVFLIVYAISLFGWISSIKEDEYSETYNQYYSFVGFNDSLGFKDSKLELMAGIYHNNQSVNYLNNRTI